MIENVYQINGNLYKYQYGTWYKKINTAYGTRWEFTSCKDLEIIKNHFE